MLGNVAVIGCGPAGLLSAAALAQAGAQVTVYERRGEKDQKKFADPGWCIGLGGCAREAIENGGLSADFGAQHKYARPSHVFTLQLRAGPARSTTT
jgi:2-polyprenyl-6-methoxyphenol hydroxylase-like FAD-dependent oxidoreductase